MENIEKITKKLVDFIEFRDCDIKVDSEGKKITFFIDDEVISPRNLPQLISDFNHVIKLIAKKYDEGPVIVDINNYRRERERIIIELARAGARRVLLDKQNISLPPMNAYERRLVHVELSMRPDIETESMGTARNRYVIIKPILKEG